MKLSFFILFPLLLIQTSAVHATGTCINDFKIKTSSKKLEIDRNEQISNATFNLLISEATSYLLKKDEKAIDDVMERIQFFIEKNKKNQTPVEYIKSKESNAQLIISILVQIAEKKDQIAKSHNESSKAISIKIENILEEYSINSKTELLIEKHLGTKEVIAIPNFWAYFHRKIKKDNMMPLY